MLIVQLDQTSLFPCSVLLGTFLGLVYGTIKVFRCLFYHNNVILFFEDALFLIFASVSFIILHYNCTFGIIRLYSFAGVVFGFILYYMTLGKLSDRVAMKLKKLFMPFFLMIKGLFLKSFSFIEHHIRTRIIVQKARKGFS